VTACRLITFTEPTDGDLEFVSAGNVHKPTMYARGSASSSGSSDTSSGLVPNNMTDPLFVHLVCSVHSQSSLRSKPVHSLPQCYGGCRLYFSLVF
jgi:hypothetical protein